MIEHRRLRRQHRRNRGAVAVEVGSQHFDPGLRQSPVQRGIDRGEDSRPAVRQVVAGDAGHHHVMEVEARRRFREALRFILFHRKRMRIVIDRAEFAVSRTASTHDEERGGSGAEALPDIRTERPGTDRIEPEVPQDSGDVRAAAAARPHPDLQPVRELRSRRFPRPLHGQLPQSEMTSAAFEPPNAKLFEMPWRMLTPSRHSRIRSAQPNSGSGLSRLIDGDRNLRSSISEVKMISAAPVAPIM
ncbi:hypothetical protein SDC9_154526 [bioreactor metagenome]|uniref:Uncharacterized protein n=1 Tax=bioreactor metagenome TaxID=1076179 RepID=A0A645F0I5_9ZZZZ